MSLHEVFESDIHKVLQILTKDKKKSKREVNKAESIEDLLKMNI